MQIRTRQNRRIRPRTIGGVLALLALIGYVGAYLVNLDEAGPVIYIDVSATAPVPVGESRRVPRFVAYQEASEVIFWPAYKAHFWISPARFEWDNSNRDTWPEWRDEWW